MDRLGFVSGLGGSLLQKPASTESRLGAWRRTCLVQRSRRASPRIVRMVAAEPEAKESNAEEFKFQAEASRVMDLVINSLYSNKEIFMRELISNASDACDKCRLLQLTDEREDRELSIRVKADKTNSTLTIQDTGVGMTRKELVDNLGSIATSGTAKFAEALGKGKADTSLIGQFGVGFYSAFLVAEKVTVFTKSFTDKDSPALKWESSDTSSYTIEDVANDDLGESGTKIVLSLKKGSEEFLELNRVSTLLKRFSEFIDFNIYSWDEKTVMEEVPDGEEKDEEGNQKMKKVPKTVEDWKLINEHKPIWLRRPKEVTQEEYNDFYKSMSRDFNDPMAQTHFSAEGEVEFRAILFTPSVLPFELRQNMFDDGGRCVKLYVKRVFISDKFSELMPRFLTFVRGVIDSEDLPLNVSREILQQSRVLRIISKRLIRKSLDMFMDIAKNKDQYKTFWDNFGRYIKAGVIDEPDYVEPLSQLLRFDTSASDELSSLQEYIERAPKDQKEIYYLVAESLQSAKSSPTTEKLTARGFEVVYLLDAVDEIAVQTLQKFKSKRSAEDKETEEFPLSDISRDNFKLPGEEDEAESEKLTEDFAKLTEYMKGVLGDAVSKVQVSTRLTESPSAIVQSQFGMSPTMERFMKSQMSGQDAGQQSFLNQSRVLEINPSHALIKDLQVRLNAGQDDDATKDTVGLLHELGLLSGGYNIEDSAGFAKRIARFMASSLSSSPVPEAKADEEDNMGETTRVNAEIVD
uniref:Histidine kinase/HSP90-like ATPase domain-containing protein n=1 Tax=Rhodosorus marinus TaxID=101924 RepID=A0A7S3EPU2_9RHOD|mmetsp:Transcript_730/g.1777  ORF Transcript_730/g.1777 Transcript_730/m.1777 type:complete len:748 (+) Transcript_730:185-2428(+)